MFKIWRTYPLLPLQSLVGALVELCLYQSHEGDRELSLAAVLGMEARDHSSHLLNESHHIEGERGPVDFYWEHGADDRPHLQMGNYFFPNRHGGDFLMS